MIPCSWRIWNMFDSNVSGDNFSSFHEFSSLKSNNMLLFQYYNLWCLQAMKEGLEWQLWNWKRAESLTASPFAVFWRTIFQCTPDLDSSEFRYAILPINIPMNLARRRRPLQSRLRSVKLSKGKFVFQNSLEVTGTFKMKKVKLVEEGFDPTLIQDPLYFLDLTQKKYIPLSQEIHNSIMSHDIKL